MIYKIFLIDGDNGISLLDAVFKEFAKKRIQDDLITEFFNAVNRTIDGIHTAMAKGRRVNEMTRVVSSEDSTVVLYYHPLSRVLFCAISDADDDTDKIKKVMSKIGNRFWKKHRSDIKNFRDTSEKSKFATFIVELENLTLGGRIAEIFPRLLVARSVLDKILSMGMINDFDFLVALKCNGSNSPLKISRMYDEKNVNDINDILKRLEQLDIIRV